MANNTPDYNDNLYFKKKIDCKNCPYTDEYCASGDCERNADVSKTLTEQWKKGELPEGHYYIKTRSETNIDEYIQWYKDHGIPSEKSFAYFNVQQVLAPVPSYDELHNMNEAVNECMAANIKLVEQNAQLKELLMQSRIYVKIDTEDYDDRTVSKAEKSEARKLLTKIDEVLK